MHQTYEWRSTRQFGIAAFRATQRAAAGSPLDRVEVAYGVAMVLPLILEDHVQASEGGLLVLGVPRVLARRRQLV